MRAEILTEGTFLVSQDHKGAVEYLDVSTKGNGTLVITTRRIVPNGTREGGMKLTTVEIPFELGISLVKA